MKRLDTLIHWSVHISAIKMDVEGAELGVLRGGCATISRCRPVIQFESAQEGKNPLYPIKDLFQWFYEHEYEIVVPNRIPHDGPPLDCAGFLDAHYYPLRTLDYFAIPAERREEVKERARRGVPAAR